MKTLHALIVAIDNYPIPTHRLNGCCNDASAFADYLAEYAKANGMTYREKRLFDAAATRQAIMDNFNHYKAAQGDDICVLYYSGHGSQMAAAPEFWDEQDGKSETLVCYDSRLANGRDMIDKELATLIWLATKDRDGHFLAVMDCCHSGSNTRDPANVKERKTRDNSPFVPRDISQFFGKEHWKKGQPPSARHVHLAAAKDDETAKELTIEGKQRGAFTYNLIKALKETGANLTYQELMSRVTQRVMNLVEKQTPQCDAYKVPTDVGLTFMGASVKKGEFLVSYDKVEGWIINVGGVQGLPSSGATFLIEKGREIRTTAVLTNYSKVDGMNLDAKDAQFKATLKNVADFTVNLPNLKVAFAKDCEPEGVSILKSEISKNKPQSIRFGDNPNEADYLIRAIETTYRLTKREDVTAEYPVFRRVEGYNVMSANAFLQNMQTVANWQAKLMLDNTLTKIQDNEFEILVLDGSDNPFPKTQKLGNKTTTLSHYELRQPSDDKEVIAQFAIKNTGSRPYWVSGVYFGSDFGITNEFLPKKQIAPGQTAWVEFENDKHIPMMIQAAYLSWGVREIQEFFKFFISTDPIDTSIHNQEALELDEKEGGKRAIQRSVTALPANDWRTILVPLKVICPDKSAV
jgi:Caspase domain